MMRLRSISMASVAGAALLLPVALQAQTYTITSATPSPIASNPAGPVSVTLAGNLPTNFIAPGFAYCFYTGYGSTVPITPVSVGPQVIQVPASSITSIPAAAYTTGVFNALLYVVMTSPAVMVNCTGASDGTLTNVYQVPIVQVPTLGGADIGSISQTNAATGVQSPPYTLIFTGTGLVKGTTINFTWAGGGGMGTVKYYSGTTLVVTVPPAVPSTVTQITATACNQTTFCSTALNIKYVALSASGGTLTAAPNPATVQQQVALTSTFSPGPNPTPGAGAPSGTVTFANGATTLGTAKLVLDKATASLQNVRTLVISAPPAKTLYTADLNADGIPDVLFVDNGTPQLLHVDLGNTPFGSFQPDLTYKLPGTCTSASSLATGDLNGDGFADVVIDCQDNGGNVFVYALLGNGDGTFAAPIAVNGALGTQVALKDMNKDGKLDLVVAGRTQGAACAINCSGFVLYTGNGDGTFTLGATTSISGLATSALLLADIDGDGFPDIVELNNLTMGAQSIDVYLSKGGTSFGKVAPPISTPSYSVPLGAYPNNLYSYLFTGDFNGDGLPDLGTVLNPLGGAANVVTALNASTAGTATFATPTAIATGVSVTDIGSADINGDGISDLLITTSASNAVFLEGDGKGSFANTYTGLTIPAGQVLDMQPADLNSDGYSDAVVVTATVGGAVVYTVGGYVTTGSANAGLNTTFAQSGTAALTATWPGNINFTGSTGKLNLTVNGASTSTSLGTSGAPSVYGQPVTFSSTVTSTTATGTPTGTITFKDGSTPLAPPVNMTGGSASLTLSTLTAGTHSISAVYSGDPVFSAGVPALLTQLVNKAQPVITWNPVPNSITYGTPLVAGQLNATASSTYFPTVQGNFFNYNPPLGALLGAGTQTLSVDFTPTDTNDFTTKAGTANISVGKFTPIITWNAPAPIVVGTPLSATQLNASAAGVGSSLVGGYTYMPPAATLLAAGPNQPLSVLFTPMDLTDYTTATGNTTITVIPLVITLVAPNSATLGATSAPITLTGTGFLPNSIVEVNGTPLVTYAYVNPTTMTATIPASYLSTYQMLSITVYDPTQNQNSSAATFTVGAPPVVGVFTGPSTTQPAQQPSLSFALTNPYPLPLSGTLTLTFANSSGANDPAIQFASGGRTSTFTIPANTTATPSFQIQSGTDAGTITITLVLTAAAQVVTPANIVPLQIVLPPAPPVITSMTLTRSANIITVNIIGYSDTRDMTQAAFHFTAAPGQTISNPDITLPAAVLFSSWYSTAPSQAYGSNFLYNQTFDLSADQSTIGSVTVTLTNSAGASATATAD
jgi:hypothetical protein